MSTSTPNPARLEADRVISSAVPGAPRAASPEYRAYLRAQRRRRLFIRLTQLLLLAVVLGTWEVSARWHLVDPMLTSQPSQIVTSFGTLWSTGHILFHTWITLQETLIGFILAMLVGTLAAVAIWWSPFLSNVLDPYLVVLNALPKIALGPIFYIWLGDRLSVYGMAVAISIIVTVMMIETGFQEVSRNKLKLMESFGATRWQMLKMVVLPANIPNFVAAMKVNVGLTLVGVIAGEFLSSKAGLGFLIIYGSQVFQMNVVMTSIAILAAMSAVLYALVSVFGNFLLRVYHFD
jgi:NitT/TauT family transport system permease protein